MTEIALRRWACPHCTEHFLSEEGVMEHMASKHAAILGVGPDAPIVTNEKGGKQSKVEAAFHLLDAKAMFRLAGVMHYGAQRYERDNWRKIPSEEHLNHALIHIFAHQAGDRQDDHLGHAFCRLMMACATEIEENQEVEA